MYISAHLKIAIGYEKQLNSTKKIQQIKIYEKMKKMNSDHYL
jgi:hypothetical protein